MTTVVNVKTTDYDIYIGRGSEWGNPYRIGKDGTRAKVIELYRQHLWERIKREEGVAERLVALDGQRLGCFCKPQACHGDVIVRAIEWAKAEITMEGEGR